MREGKPGPILWFMQPTLNATLRTSADGRLLSSPRYFTAAEAHKRAAAFVAAQPVNGPAVALVHAHFELTEYSWSSGSVVNGQGSSTYTPELW